MTTRILTLAVVLLLPVFSRAACCYFSAQNNDVLQPAQKVFISWNPDTKTETFTVQPKFEGSSADFGMVIPTPARPKLDEMPRDFFKALATFTILEPVDWEKFSKPSFSGKTAPAPAAEYSADFNLRKSRASTVKVVEAGVVGSLDYKIITAERADDVYDWLKENKYSYNGDEATLGHYVSKKWFFTVMKIDTKQIRNGFLKKTFTGELTPTRFRFQSPALIYPLRITQKSVKDSTEMLMYVQAPEKVDLPAAFSYQDSWQWMWRQGFDQAPLSKMTETERAWYAHTEKLAEPCFTRVKELQAAGRQAPTLEWAKRITSRDAGMLSGSVKFNREAPAESVSALQCLRGHVKTGQVITKIRKVFKRDEMNDDLVLRTASFGGRADRVEYFAGLPSSPP